MIALRRCLSSVAERLNHFFQISYTQLKVGFLQMWMIWGVCNLILGKPNVCGYEKANITTGKDTWVQEGASKS